MSGDVRIEHGLIIINGTRKDDGTIECGTGGEMRFSPFEAMSQRQDAQITWGQHPHGVGATAGFLAPLGGSDPRTATAVSGPAASRSGRRRDRCFGRNSDEPW